QDRDNYGNFQRGHLAKIVGNRLSLAAFLGVDARIGSRRVDKSDQRAAKFLSHLHQAKSFTITFRFRHSEVPVAAFVDVAAFLLTYDRDFHSLDLCKPANDRRIVRISAITVNLNKIGKKRRKKIKRIRTLGVTCGLNAVKGCCFWHSTYSTVFSIMMKRIRK